MGEARIIMDNVHLLHIINTTAYTPLITQNTNNLIKHVGIITDNKKLGDIFGTRTRTIGKQIQKLQETLNLMNPKERSKRGIHIIFGNIEQADMTQIQLALDKIHTNENLLGNKINEQININNEMINRFRKIEELIANEGRLLTQAINENTKNNKMIENAIIFEQSLHHLENNIKELQNHLDNILDSITLAKQNYISHYLLTKNETNMIISTLEDQEIVIHSEHQLFQFLKINILYRKPLIVFSISIPKFSSEKFNQFQIFPTTINKTSHIHIPEHFLILSPQNIKFSQHPCNEIQEKYYCNESDLKDIEDKCISNIIRNKPADCDIIQSPVKETINLLHKQYIAINSNTNQEYSTTCGVQKTKEIPNTALIKFYNCSVNIAGINFNNEEIKYTSMFNIEPYHEIKINNSVKQIELPTLANWTITNMERMKEFHKITIPIQHHQVAWSITTIIIFSIIIYLCILRYCPTCTPCAWYRSIRKSNDFIIPTTIKDVEDNIHLKGEQLRNTTPPLFPILQKSTTTKQAT